MIIVWLKNTIYQENYPYMLPLKLEYFPIRWSEEKNQYILLFKFGDVPIVWFRTLLSKEIKKYKNAWPRPSSLLNILPCIPTCQNWTQ